MIASGTAETFPLARQAGLAAAILCAVMACAYVDRQILAILVEPIRKTLHVSDTQIGLLQGTAFIMVYAAMGVPFGRLVDRHTRKYLLCLGIVIWSVMTIACGLADSFWLLFAARGGVGLGEAILAPATFSMLADYFPPARRGRAIAAVALFGSLGSGLSYMLGGAVLDLVPGDSRLILPFFGAIWGWQLAFLVAGLPGVLIAMIVLAMKEPSRHEETPLSGKRPPAHFVRYAMATPQTFFPVYFGSALLAGVAYAVGAWGAAHFIRAFGLPPGHVGYVMGIVTIVGGVVGGFSGGIISDRLVRRNDAGRLQVLIVCATVGVLFLGSWPLVSNSTLAFGLLLLSIGSISIGTSTASVMIQEVVPNYMRGEALGYYFLLQGIIGPGLGPVSVALVSDNLFSRPGGLALAIVTVCVPVIIMVGALAWWGSRSYAASRRLLLGGAVIDQGGASLRS